MVVPVGRATGLLGKLLARGATVVDVLPSVGVLIAFAAGFIAAGVCRFGEYE